MPERSNKTALFLVFATVCIDLLGFGLVLPLLPIYGKELIADLPGNSGPWVLGVLMCCFSMMQFLFSPLWGRLSDRIGRRPVLLISLAGSTLFYTLFGLASMWRSLTWMFVARIAAGISGATISTAQAYIADVTPPEKRTRGMALIGAAFGLGFTLGPLIGAAAIFISRDTGLSPWPGYAAAGLSAMALTLAIFKLPESLDRGTVGESHRHFDLGSLRAALAVPSIGLLLLTSFLSVFSLAGFEGTISLAIHAGLDRQTQSDVAVADLPDRSQNAPPDAQAEAQTAGESSDADDWTLVVRLMLIFAYIGVIQTLVQGILVRRLADRVREVSLALTGAILCIIGFLLLTAAVASQGGGIALLMVGAAVKVSGIAFLFPAIQSLISRRSDPTKQGSILGAGESIAALARITGVVFGVRLFYRTPTLPFLASAALMCFALVLVVVAVRAGQDFVEAEA